MRNFTAIFAKFVDFVFGLFGVLLGVRFLFRLFGANSNNGFVEWLYTTSAPLIDPFENIFQTVRLEDGFVIEISTLLAIVMYGLAAALISSLLYRLSVAE